MIADIIPKIAGMGNDEHEYYPRPSMAGPERCIRSMVYHGLKVPRSPMPGRAILIFDDSSWHEELTADWIRKSAYQLHSVQMEVTIPGKMTLTGHIDGIITDLTGKDYLIEHKAINHFTFQKYWAGEVPLDYLTQTCLYAKGLQQVNPDINEALLLIKNKNTAQYMEFRIVYEDDTAKIIERCHSTGERIPMDYKLEHITESAFQKFADVQDYIEKKTLPKRQYDIDTWRCEYCGWYQECWKNYQEEFETLSTQGMLDNEAADAVRYYKELAAQETDIKKEKEKMKEIVKSAMKEIDAREAAAGEYICKLTLAEREKLDKALIPYEILEKATTKSITERFTVSRVKGGKAA
jgi:hypothetical protein